MSFGHFFANLPSNLETEVFEDIVRADSVRIERIISYGQGSPESGWYDQNEHEWVMVVQGSAAILFDNGHEYVLKAGDYLTIPAHQKHKVLWTEADNTTLWLAVFYSAY